MWCFLVKADRVSSSPTITSNFPLKHVRPIHIGRQIRIRHGVRCCICPIYRLSVSVSLISSTCFWFFYIKTNRANLVTSNN